MPNLVNCSINLTEKTNFPPQFYNNIIIKNAFVKMDYSTLNNLSIMVNSSDEVYLYNSTVLVYSLQ